MHLLGKKLTKLKLCYCELRIDLVRESYIAFNSRQVEYLDGYIYTLPHHNLCRKYIYDHIRIKNFDDILYSESDLDLKTGMHFIYATN